MYNKVIMIGHLARDVELRHIPSGTAIANSSIATSYKYGDREETCFLDFSAFGKPAEIMHQYLKKGSKVMLEGRLILEQWDDKNTGTKRSRHTLRVENFKFLDNKGGSNPQEHSNVSTTQNTYEQHKPNTAPKEPKKEELPSIDIDDDEIPF